jgi:hypothetical protein
LELIRRLLRHVQGEASHSHWRYLMFHVTSTGNMADVKSSYISIKNEGGININASHEVVSTFNLHHFFPRQITKLCWDLGCSHEVWSYRLVHFNSTS